ncbi:MAG: hypothetical protein Q9166_002257 [cf. Caloplaca sp. 2 TL-2023]
MSLFTALNIEPESDSEDEIDNSKEIQIEEALKLYQNALKLHSQGPQFFDQAEEAYNALFRSEVFTYLESLSETQRVDYYENAAESLTRFDENLVVEPVAAASSVDGTPSTLPQILYLSYKNRGHFLLDRLKYRLHAGWNHGLNRDQITNAQKEISETIRSSLDLLVEALDRDDTDLELWRQLSKIGESLGSARLARFCLEVVADRDDVSADAWPEPLGLQEVFATERLKSLLQRLNDDLSESTVPTLTRKQQALIQSFKPHLDPLPYLPLPQPDSPSVKTDNMLDAPKVSEIFVPLRTWASCGKAILLQLQKEAQGLVDVPFGASYTLVLPPSQPQTDQKALGDIVNHHPGHSHSTADNSNLLPQYDGAPEKEQSNSDIFSEQLPQSAFPKVSEKIDAPTKLSSSAHDAADDVPAGQGSINAGDLREGDARTVTLPTRKRSNDIAELEEGEDAGRSRSKRIKARASIEEPTSRKDAAAKQLELYQQGELRFYELLDEQAFGQSAKVLSAFGVAAPESANELKAQVYAVVKPPAAGDDEAGKVASNSHQTQIRDLAISVHTWNSEMSNVFLHGGGFEDPISGAGVTRNSGLLVFLEQSGLRPRDGPSKSVLDDDRGVEPFVESIKNKWMPLDQLAFTWIKALLSAKSSLSAADPIPAASTYETLIWPDTLKETVVQVLVTADEFIFRAMMDEVMGENERRPDLAKSSEGSLHPDTGMIQTIFEIHLDVYGRITNPSSEVDLSTRTAQRDRLQRWASLAHQAFKYHEKTHQEEIPGGTLSNRFLWAFAVLANLCEMCSRDLVILYFHDLKQALKELGNPVIELHNNAIMPEISTEAAEKQISRLTTMDFFTSVFSPESDDPVKLIEILEPILEISIRRELSNLSTTDQRLADTTNDGEAVKDSDENLEKETSSHMVDPNTEQMLQFLDKASLPMRLLLWRRLIEAYSIIHYPPRILLCYMRCVRLILGYLYSAQHLKTSDDSRRKELLRWLKSIDELLTWTLALALSDSKSLECMDESNLQDAMLALTALQYVLHSFIVVEDLIRIGQCDPPKQANNSANTAYSNGMARIREMVVKVWSLQYVFMRERANQGSTETPAINANLINYLKLTHRLLGPRQYCKLSNKVLLKLLRDEIPRLDNVADSELESAQLALDLYGLKICPGSKEIEDHGCSVETLNRSNAIAMIDRVIVQANRLSIKDLVKSELRLTIEKMQQVIKIPKNTSAVLHNRRVFNDFMRSPINPLSFYRAIQGIGNLHFQDLRGEIFQIAEKGWYFLQGYLALAKYRSQKRTSPAGADELDVALMFLKYDLEQGYEKWETWYRLAQVYDAKIEEETLWTAEKLNSDMDGITNLQRCAIHCYTMAVATAERCAEPSFNMFQKVADLHYNFATRIYGSSREPFSMEAFSVEKFTKHFNGGQRGMYQEKPFRPVTLYSACKLASGLLRRALVQKPDNWMTWFMLGKCLWKMYNCKEIDHSGHYWTGFQPAVTAFKAAIEALPERRDNKHSEKEPVLEPHYKLASVVHKLVSTEKLEAETACQILNATPYARRVPPIQDPDDWEGYILHVLKVLRTADKPNWHHRMVLRAAHTIYEGSPNDHLALLGAKVELTPQIFTKVMAIQIWKPEYERVGRHFVYTTRYVQFFLRILFELKDTATIDALGRQIRKKSAKFFRHTALWHELCMTHLTLLRTHSGVPNEYSDTAFKNISHDLFVQNADRLEAWAHQPATIARKAPEIELMREAIELKKTNANLMKPAVIEDFIADVYAYLYQKMTPELIGLENEEESRSRMRVDHLMNSEKPVASTPSPDPAGKAEDVAPTRQRIRGVGRREIQKRAEALMSKPVAAQAAAKMPKSPVPSANEPPTPRSTIQVVIKQKDPKNDNSSVPGSLHDSADDESELSDVEDVAATTKARPLFPNLGDSRSGADDEDREGIGSDTEKGEDDEPEDEGNEPMEEDEVGDVEGEGEEIYHTPMEM